MPAAQDVAPVTTRLQPDIPLPLVSCEGTAFECGEQLGGIWKEALTLEAGGFKSDRAWWKDRRCARLISKLAPHLPDASALEAELASLADPAAAIAQEATE